MTMTSSPPEPYGTTPLPTSSGADGNPVRVTIDTSTLFSNADTTPQQPQTHQLAAFDASPPSDDTGSLLAVNPHFVVYAVKNGLIRVLHRHSSLRSLLRLHKNQTVTDIQFFQDGDILATAGHSNSQASTSSSSSSSSVFVWRVYEKTSEICSDVLLEIQAASSSLSRVLWHPFNPNQFWMLHTSTTTTTTMQRQRMASLVESTRLESTPHASLGHPVCRVPDDNVLVNGAIQLSSSSSSNITDLCWSKQQTKHVLTVFDNGDVVLWDLKQLNNNNTDANGDATTTKSRAVAPACLGKVQEDGPVSQCLFLLHDNALAHDSATGGGGADNYTPCFVTGTHHNRVITLWSPFSPKSLPTKLQIVSLEHPSPSYLLSACFGPAPPTASPPCCFLVLADRAQGRILALHCQSEWNAQDGKAKRAILVGCDYVVPFRTQHPTYSWSVEAVPTTDISEEELSEQGSLIFDMKLFAYQSSVVQALTLTSYMCLPPEHTWTEPTPGVQVQPLLLPDTSPAVVSDADSTDCNNDELQYDENYDIEDDEDDDDFDAPDASALPPPPAGFSDVTPAPAMVINPFSNWLGAIAGNVTAPTEPAKPVPPPHQPSLPTPLPASDLPSPVPPTALPAFLSPMDILKGAPPPATSTQAPAPSSGQKSRELTPTTSNAKGRMKSPNAAQPQILKREDPVPATGRSTSKGEDRATAESNKKDEPSLTASDLSDSVRQAIREEVRATLMPQMQGMLDKTLKAIVVNDLRAAIGKIKLDTGSVATVVSQNIESSMQTAFSDSIRTVMIPTLESVTKQVLAKVSDQLDKDETVKAETNRDMESLVKQVGAMTQLVVKLTEEVHSLREVVAKQQETAPAASPAPASTPATGANDKLKSEILASLNAKNYSDAFTKAVSASTSEIAIFCCSNADINAVLGGATPELGQMILLCLMQQLGTVLGTQQPPNASTNLQLALEWLQEIALTLNPKEPSIAKHVPSVLQQLVAGINARMAQNDPALRRPLQRLLQVVRGMQMT